MPQDKNRLDATLLSKIVFARFLENPLRAFDRFVSRVESSPEFAALARWVSADRLDDAQMADAFPGPSLTSATLGEARETDGRLLFFYHRESYVREYLFDEVELRRLRASHEFAPKLVRTVHQLRLINSRNRLTHALVKTLLAAQAEYLRSGEPLALAPLTQAQVSARLRAEANVPMVADAGRVSRLTRGLSIVLPNRKTIPLAHFFPGPRQTHCHFVDHVIKREPSWVEQGVIGGPLSDQAIAEVIGREKAICLSRRTVANIRRALGIPDSRQRAQRASYLTATEGFSALVPLTQQALRGAVPAHSGVYEIRSDSFPELAGQSSSCVRQILASDSSRVVYIGSAGDLRKRLGDHLRGSSGNILLHRCITDGAAKVRYRLVSDGWRWAERELYRIFCETFGAPPLANRMSP